MKTIENCKGLELVSSNGTLSETVLEIEIDNNISINSFEVKNEFGFKKVIVILVDEKQKMEKNEIDKY